MSYSLTFLTTDVCFISGSDGTCFEAVDGKRGLGEKVLVVKHVDLIHHKTQEGKGRIAHGEAEGLSGPRGVQTVVRCKIDTKNNRDAIAAKCYSRNSRDS